ncbi:MAG: 4'-phosphopantetheinyl transferase superfamily protein [Gemmatimonadota bacterium]|nr:4'-phosphopantetheinyl transferase superfamily protein [Gemmatimonadota bacterium]
MLPTERVNQSIGNENPLSDETDYACVTNAGFPPPAGSAVQLTAAAWETPADPLDLRNGEAHIWRVPLNHGSTPADIANLSDAERTRAQRFHSSEHGDRYTVAHGTLRRILSRYTGLSAERLHFAAREHGKPYLTNPGNGAEQTIHFNLSHSADMALVAVSASGEVGVDVEHWRDDVRHVEIAERFFSVAERVALRACGTDLHLVMQAFFAGWSRKEAYIKASGFGISRGLTHFDVSLEATVPAAILGDRLDATATSRWSMADIDVGPGYSAALVATAPLTVIRRYDATSI